MKHSGFKSVAAKVARKALVKRFKDDGDLPKK